MSCAEAAPPALGTAEERAQRRAAWDVLRRAELRLGLDPWRLRDRRAQARADAEGCGAVWCAVRLARGELG